MKIKTKKQLNLPQLIEWGFENDVTGSIYSNDRVEAKKIRFEIGVIASMYGDMHKGDTFTVEVEEEITEDTVIPKILSIGRKNQNEIDIHYSCRIGQFIDNEDFNYYVLNDDDMLTLIWRDGKLVE